MGDGSISTLVSVLAYGVVYAGDDVVVPGGRYVLWRDNADYWSQPNFFEVFVNIVDFLLTCEVENECGGIECGTGVVMLVQILVLRMKFALKIHVYVMLK